MPLGASPECCDAAHDVCPGWRPTAVTGRERYRINVTQRGESKHRSIRLRGYDYSTPGAYFITACTHNRLLLFGRVVNGKVAADRLGSVVEDCWRKLPDHYENVALDAFILMPNHIHGVIIIGDGTTNVGAGLQPALPAAVGSRRHGVPESYAHSRHSQPVESMKCVDQTGTPVWQRGFYDHVIRGERELDRVRTYIMDNPRRWSEDTDNPANWRGGRRV